LTRGRAIRPSSAATHLHELRKDAKQLRYLLECFGGILPAGPRKAFVKRLKALQNNLGEHQDAQVHIERLRAFEREIDGRPHTAETRKAMRQLQEHLERRRAAARDDFAQRFTAYDSKATRRGLRQLLGAG
jgi:CHAD domain-containing protein